MKYTAWYETWSETKKQLEVDRNCDNNKNNEHFHFPAVSYWGFYILSEEHETANNKHSITIWLTKQIIHNRQEGNTQLLIQVGLIKQFKCPTVNTKKTALLPITGPGTTQGNKLLTRDGLICREAEILQTVFKGYLLERRRRAPLKKCGMLKLDSTVHRLESDIVSKSCQRGRCNGGFWRPTDEKRWRSGFVRMRPPPQSWQVLLQQLSLGPNFLCTGTSAASCGINTVAQRGHVVLLCPQIKKK